MKKTATWIAISVALLLALGATSSRAADDAMPEAKLEGKALIAELQKGGYVIYLRHASTDKSQKDEDVSDFAKCETQRNLSDAGRAEALHIGEAIKRLGINISSVVSSPYCRCTQTADLAFGKHEVSDLLYFAFRITDGEKATLTAGLREMLGTQPEAGTNAVIVSHTANLRAAAGIWPKPEGVAVIFKPGEDGKFDYIGHIDPTDWAKF